jgi:hypothetical protein
VGAVWTQARTVRLPLTPAPSFWTSVRVALPAWILARVLVLGTLALVLYQSHGTPVAGPLSDVRHLKVWDVAWYGNLGVNGYGSYGPMESRFFPLLPLAVGVGHTFGLPTNPWITGVCWLAALAFAAALHRLMLTEVGDEGAARRAAWLIQLVPGANVLALGYTEAFAGLLGVTYFLVIRTRRDVGVGTIAGLLSGLARPTGMLLSIAGAIELFRNRNWKAVLLAAAPVLGTGLYLAWAWHAFGQPLTPYKVQASTDLRGAVVNVPWEFLTRTSDGGYPWKLVLVLLAAAAVLLVVCARTLPASYTGWALVSVAAAVTAYGLHSLPRYLAAVFPLVMAAAIVCRNRWAWYAFLGLCLYGFTWVSYFNLTSGPVP